MKTVRETKLGDATLRLVEKDKLFVGLVFEGGSRKLQIQGENADDVWRQLHDEAGKANPKYFGFDGARGRFLKFFPNGFKSDGYLNNERNYKVAAKKKLDATAPVQDAATKLGFGEAILAAFRSTNLLSPYEKTWLQDVLRGPSADPFINSAARFALGEGKSALLDMERALKPHGAAKWTIATYLPFLWRPQQHMFLKPEVTKDFATRVGHRFASIYEAALEFSVYESLLDLATKTAKEISDLNPQDRIDVQSFIWVIGDYKEGREQPSL